MNANEFMQAVDHAAGMNDRWLFLAAFCLLLVGCGLVIFWLENWFARRAIQAEPIPELGEG